MWMDRWMDGGKGANCPQMCSTEQASKMPNYRFLFAFPPSQAAPASHLIPTEPGPGAAGAETGRLTSVEGLAAAQPPVAKLDTSPLGKGGSRGRGRGREPPARGGGVGPGRAEVAAELSPWKVASVVIP